MQSSLIQIQIVGEVFQIHFHVLLPFINQKYLSPRATLESEKIQIEILRKTNRNTYKFDNFNNSSLYLALLKNS